MNIVPKFIRNQISHRPNLVKIIDNLSWLFFDKALRMGVGLAVGVWIARYLGPEQYGIFNFTSAFVGIFYAVASLGLQSIVVRDIVRDSTCKEQTLGTSAGLLFLGGFIGYICLIGSIFLMRPEDKLTIILVTIMGTVLLFKFSDVALYWFESQVASKYTVWVQNSSFILFSLIKIILIIEEAPLVYFACATASEAIVAAVLLLIMLSIRGPDLNTLKFSFERSKSLLANSWPLLLSAITVNLYMRVDQIMLGQLAGHEEVGIFSVAVRISEIWYFIPSIIAASASPSIIEARVKDKKIYIEKLKWLLDINIWLSLAIAFPLSYLSNQMVVSLFGLAYAGSGTVLSIHIWGAVFVFLGVAGNQWYLAENQQRLGFCASLLGLATNIILNYVLIPINGAIGAAYATIISYAVAALLFDCINKKTRELFFMKLDTLNIMRLRYIGCELKNK